MTHVRNYYARFKHQPEQNCEKSPLFNPQQPKVEENRKISLTKIEELSISSVYDERKPDRIERPSSHHQG